MQDFSKRESERYRRHFILPQVGQEGQKKLKNTRVLCIGAGGIGSPLLLYLAGAGVGTIGVIDPDIVELSNLHRQVLYTQDDINQPKVEAAKKHLLALNSDIQIEVIQAKLREENALEIISAYDIVADGSDNFVTRFLVNDACMTLHKPNIYASVGQFDGQLSVFPGTGGPCYRCLYPEAPPPDLIPSCVEGGVLGVLPGILGSLQALEVIKIALGIGKPLVGRLLVFDALTMNFREYEVSRRQNCDLCGKNIPFEKLKRPSLSCNKMRNENTISVEDLKILIEQNYPHILLDVRDPDEFALCNMGGRLIPLGDLPHRYHELDQSALIIVHCKLGGRGKKAMEFLKQKGFAQVKNLEGGIAQWLKQ